MPIIPEAEAAITALRGVQTEIAVQQTVIKTSSLFKSLSVMKEKVPSEDEGKLSENFSPTKVSFPHGLKSSLLLHVEKQSSYESETGAPLQLDSDFGQRQKVRGELRVKTESFLDIWPHMPRAPDMLIICEAKIQMENLEDKWSAQLVRPEVKPSLRLLLE